MKPSHCINKLKLKLDDDQSCTPLVLSKNEEKLNKGPGSVILYQSVGPVHYTPFRYWVQIPR